VPDSIPPARALRSMQIGQNSVAPESSLPQLGQVRWGSVFMGLTALQPQPDAKATPCSTERCEIGPARLLAYCCSVARAIRVTVASEIALRNKIPAACVLRGLNLMTRFGDGRFESTSRVPATFNAPGNRVVSQKWSPASRQTTTRTLSKLGYFYPGQYAPRRSRGTSFLEFSVFMLQKYLNCQTLIQAWLPLAMQPSANGGSIDARPSFRVRYGSSANSLSSRFAAWNHSGNVEGKYEPIQRLLCFQRHRSSDCPDRGTEFGWSESSS
jgi:hypothetical protein